MAKKHFKFTDFCQCCRKVMGPEDNIVYVEEDSGRYFCSEKCIRQYYDPMGEHYKKLHMSERDNHDIPEADFPQFESYAPLCLSNPDEVWRDESDSGETCFFFIGNYMDQGGAFSYVVMCFCMEFEPTYILLSFPTRDKRLVDKYRVGARVDMTKAEADLAVASAEPEMEPAVPDAVLARQARALEEEMLRHRSKGDIPPTDFEEHAHLLEHTLENPEEVWELQDEKNNTILTLIAQPEEDLYYVVICNFEESAEGRENWRVLYHFPTRDSSLAQHYRRGMLREGAGGGASSSFIQ